MMGALSPCPLSTPGKRMKRLAHVVREERKKERKKEREKERKKKGGSGSGAERSGISNFNELRL